MHIHRLLISSTYTKFHIECIFLFARFMSDCYTVAVVVTFQVCIAQLLLFNVWKFHYLYKSWCALTWNEIAFNNKRMKNKTKPIVVKPFILKQAGAIEQTKFYNLYYFEREKRRKKQLKNSHVFHLLFSIVCNSST